MEDFRYPVGKFEIDKNITRKKCNQWIEEIENTPASLYAAVDGLTEKQLDTPYRPQGWTVKQVVHHLADSHMNAYMRFKLTLTENEPTIRTYDQDLWSELIDAKTTPIEISLTLLKSLHQRWVVLLNSLTEQDFSRKFNHPEWGVLNLGILLNLYAWHGRHHIAHINSLRERMGW